MSPSTRVVAKEPRARGTSETRSGLRLRLELAGALLLVAGIVAWAHWPVLSAQARSFDDSQVVRNNPLVNHPGWPSAWRFFSEVLKPTTVKGYYYPLSLTSLMLDVAMGGRPDDFRVFHRTSLALHVTCAVLIVLILYRLFGALIPAAIVGLAFGLHPLAVEPIAWVAERKTLLAAIFAFGCVACHVEYSRGNGRAWRIAGVSLYALALLSKPTVIMLPLLLLLLDFWPLRRLRPATVVEKWPFFVLALASGVTTLISQQRTAGIGAMTESSLLRWPLQACYVLAFYLGKIVRPTSLSCAYQPPQPFALSHPAVLVSVIVVCSLTLLLVLLARRARGPLAGWLFFVIALAPTLGLVQYSWVIASDKFVYFPALGLLMVFASGLSNAWGSRRLAGLAPKAVALVLAGSILAAEARGVRATLSNWTDSLTLTRHMERIAPDSPAVNLQLGVAYGESGATEEAFRHLRRALEIAPEYALARYNLGLLLATQGQLGESIPHLQKASELMPDDPEAACLFGIALRRTGRLDEAAAQFRRAIGLRADLVQAYDQLGEVLVVQGRTEEAVTPLRMAVALSPTDPLLRFRLASVLGALGGHLQEALGHLRQAVEYKPDWPEALNALAWLQATSPDPTVRDATEAVRHAERAAALSSRKVPEILDTLAAAEAAAGHFEQAARTAREAADLATRAHAAALAKTIRSRLAMYVRGTAYTESASPAVPAPR